MNEGYIKIPRSLLNDPLWKSLPFTYRHVYLTILQHMVFKETTYDDFGVLVTLKPGELITTVRRLAVLCDEPDIDKSLIERALAKFEKVGFSRQTSRHRKTIVTITRKDICELIETRIETNSRQTRDIKEESKERKEQSLHKGNVALEKPNVPVIASLPFSKKKKNQRLNEKQQETFEWLLKLDLNSDEDTLRYWAKTWEREKIEKAYCFMLMESKKKRIKNPGGFIREILKGTIIVVDDASIANMENAKRFSQQHPELNLKLNEKYVSSEKVTDTDIYYYLPSKDFERQLEALCDKAYAYL